MGITEIIELMAAISMIIALIGVLHNRIKRDKGFGVRIIQFLAVSLLAPLVLILALEDKLSGETAATIIGTIVGYVLSGIGQDEPNAE